jgi:hypothetical protein
MIGLVLVLVRWTSCGGSNGHRLCGSRLLDVWGRRSFNPATSWVDQLLKRGVHKSVAALENNVQILDSLHKAIPRISGEGH